MKEYSEIKGEEGNKKQWRIIKTKDEIDRLVFGIYFYYVIPNFSSIAMMFSKCSNMSPTSISPKPNKIKRTMAPIITRAYFNFFSFFVSV